MKNQQSPLFWALILYKAPAQSSDPALFKYTGCTKKGVIFPSNGVVWRSVHLKIGDWGRDSWWQDGKFFWKAFLFVVNWNCYWEQQQPYIQQKTIVRERRKIRRNAVLPTLETFYTQLRVCAAATINFKGFQRPFLLSELQEVTKGAATN